MKIPLWVHKNIVYNRAYTGKKFSVMEVFNNKAEVRHDITVLSNALLYSLGYKVIYVTGYAAGSSYKFTKSELHAWSLIKIDGKWYPFDSTWGIILGKIPISHIFTNYFDKDSSNYKTKDSIKYGKSKTLGNYIPKIKLKT